MCLPCQYDEPANTDRLLCSRLSRLGCFWVAAYPLSLQRRIKDDHLPKSGSMAFMAETPLHFELPCAYESPLGFQTLRWLPCGALNGSRIKPRNGL